MAYARKKSGGSNSYSRGNSGGGRGTTKRASGSYRKSAPAKSAGRRVTTAKPQTIRIEIVGVPDNQVSRPTFSARVVEPRKAQF